MFNRFSFVLVLLAASLLATSGCTHNVRYTQHAPYPSAIRYNAPLVVVVPDGHAELIHEFRAGTWMDRQTYKIRYGEGLKYEVLARFQTMFQPIAVVEASQYAKLTPSPDSGAAFPELVAGTTTDPDDEDYIDAPDFVREAKGYALRIDRIDYTIEEKRARYIFNVSFEDRFTGDVLVEGRLRGGGNEIGPRNSPDNVRTEIRKSSTAALSQALIPFGQRVAQAIEQGAAAP